MLDSMKMELSDEDDVFHGFDDEGVDTLAFAKTME